MRRNIPMRKLGLAALLALCAAPAFAAPAFLPPDLDYKTVCATIAAVPSVIDRDWTQWQGEAVTTVPDDMFALASEYLHGSERLPQSLPTAKAMLDYLDERGTISRPRIDRLLGRSIVNDPAATLEDLKRAETYLLAAFDGGLDRAAIDLADLYGVEGPAALRDPRKARQFYRIAAAAGDAEGQLAYARILAADPNAPQAERTLATSNAMLGMIQAVAGGECRYMGTIGNLYLRGELVAQDYKAAVAWFEQFAETGDARTEERLAQLLTSRFVEKVDYDRAMVYFEAAALQGRGPSALTVGIAYATGAQRPRDLALADKFLTIASDKGLVDADVWLARLYRGEFGGTPDPDRARTHFETALARAPDSDIEAQFAELLAATGRPEDRARAITLLEHAAIGGSGKAAVLAARLAYDTAEGDADQLRRAEALFRLGVERGRPEAARQLSKLSLCGAAVEMSPANAEAWNTRAVYLGSTTGLFEAARAALASADSDEQSRGKVLLKQATYNGVPSALAYSIAHLETGRGGFGIDLPEAQKLLRFISANPDPAFRANAELELVKARLNLAEDEAEIAAQYARLDQLIASGVAAASVLKADALENTGTADPLVLTGLYKIGAEAGDRRAMREYAELLALNPETYPLSAEWLRKAAEAGDLKAKIALVDLTAPDALGQLTALGKSGLVCTVDERVSLARTIASIGTPEALTEAAGWLTTATQIVGASGDDYYKIADAYRDGLAGPERVADAEQYFNLAAENGRPEALKDIADGYMTGIWKDSTPERARTALASLVDNGDPAAGPMMIKAILNQQITAPLEEVEKLLEGNSAVDGDTYMKLIRLDEAGVFGEIHPDKQALWLTRAAEGGSTGAMMRLYRAYASGIGVQVSAEMASTWLMKAAEAGDQRAASELAAAYDTGFGLSPDPVKAAYWRDRAKALS